MKKNISMILNILYFLLVITLFFPWILNPNPETFNIDTVAGYKFLYNNPFILIIFIISLFTYIIFLKFKNNNLRIFVILELIFLLALLISPITYNLDYLVGVLFGYYSANAILIILVILHSVNLFKE